MRFDRNKQISAFGATILTLLSTLPCQARVEPAWRTLGRQANIRLWEKRYGDSIDCYQKAIAALPSSEKRDDVRLDLLLAQAEAYRLWGRFNESGVILDEVKRELPKGVARDPTLEARYWRRRADLSLSLKQYDQAAEALRNQLVVVRKFFHPTSKHYLSIAEDACNKLVYADQPILLADFLRRDVLNQIPMDSEFGKIVEDTFIHSFEAIHSKVWLLSAHGEFIKAKNLLFTLQEIEPDKTGIAMRWLLWIGECVSRNQRNQFTDDVSDHLFSLIKFFKEHPSVENTHQRIVCHEAIEYMYRETKQTELEQLQSNALISAIEELLPDNANSRERIMILIKLNTLASTEIEMDQKGQAALSALRKMVKYSSMPPRGIDSGNLKAYRGFHVMGRIRLARHCGRMGLFDEAEKSLASIDPEAKNVSPLRVEDTHMKLAEFYLDHGKFPEAERHLQEAEKLAKTAGALARIKAARETLAKERMQY